MMIICTPGNGRLLKSLKLFPVMRVNCLYRRVIYLICTDVGQCCPALCPILGQKVHPDLFIMSLTVTTKPHCAKAEIQRSKAFTEAYLLYVKETKCCVCDVQRRCVCESIMTESEEEVKEDEGMMFFCPGRFVLVLTPDQPLRLLPLL